MVILRDGLLVGTEVFVPGQYTLGAGEASDLKLDDGSVEQSHAYLYFQNGKVAIQDAGSTTGVFVNGHKIATCEVRPVDELQIGPFVLKLRVLAQKPVAKAAPPPEVAALLGGPAGGQPRSPAAAPGAKPAATVVSPRRLAAVPQQAPVAAPPTVPPPQARSAAHLRPVEDFRDEVMTENVVVGKSDAEDSTRTDAMPAMKHPRAAPPAVARGHAPAPHGHGQATTIPARPPQAQAKAPAHHPPPKQPAAAHPPHAQGGHPGRKKRHSLPSLPMPAEGKGKPKLFIELYWGEQRRHANAFGPIKAKHPVVGAPDDLADVPLYGFNVKEKFVVADQKGSSYRLFIPPGSAVEARGKDGNFYPLPADQLQATGSRKFVALGNGSAVRLSGDSEMTLVAYCQPPLKKPFVNPLRGLPWLALFFLIVNLSGFAVFVAFAPKDDAADFEGRKMSPVAVRLIAPEPKKREEIKKKVEEIKKKAPEKKVQKKAPEAPKVVTKKPEVVPQAIKKLTAAGPAMKDLLAAVDKLGSGPGSKLKNFKVTDMIGKAPIANAGLGTFGLGGGGAGGQGTRGLEVLRGKGGGGIGALGAGNIGKGSVGGTVNHAVSRSIGAQGSIDKEAVAKVINSHLQEVRACYEKALLKDPSLAGKVVLEWNISTAGLVTTAKTKSSSLRNASVESCILSALKTWKFPPAKGAGVLITYPFMFNSVGF